MKKGILSIFIVFITILSCTYMLTYRVPNKVNYNNAKLQVPENSNDTASTKDTENQTIKDDKLEEEDTNMSESNVPDTDTSIDFPIVEDTKSVFKVSKDSISVSSIEKLKLLYIYKKLNEEDESKITEFLNEDGEDAVKSIFHLLRDRLSNEDYQYVKDVTSRFINLDVAEK